jgi:hypothetical protein
MAVYYHGFMSNVKIKDLTPLLPLWLYEGNRTWLKNDLPFEYRTEHSSRCYTEWYYIQQYESQVGGLFVTIYH